MDIEQPPQEPQSPDQDPDDESPSDLAVAEILKDKGPDDENAKVLLKKWLDARQAEVTRDNSSTAALQLNIRQARIYEAANLDYRFLIEHWEWVQDQAANEGDTEAWDEAKQAIDRIVLEQEVRKIQGGE